MTRPLDGKVALAAGASRGAALGSAVSARSHEQVASAVDRSLRD